MMWRRSRTVRLTASASSTPSFTARSTPDLPAVLKRYRAVARASTQGPAGIGADASLNGFLWMAFYPAIGFTSYIRRQVHMVQVKMGLSRAEILELYAVAFLDFGPRGMEVIAEGLQDYQWLAQPSAFRWPHGWAPDQSALRSGVDLSTPTMLPGELEAIVDWHRRVEGEVPDYVELLGTYHPDVLKAHRCRFENLVPNLPVQVVPSMLLHHALLRKDRHSVRENVLRAKGLGMTRDELVHMAVGTVIYGIGSMSLLQEAAGDVLAGWNL
jgi:hypothetical protein